MTNELETLKGLIDQIAEETQTGGPAEFLARTMAGEDPRKQGRNSELYETVKKIYDEMREPTYEEWMWIEQLVIYTDLYRPVPVSHKASMFAAEELMKYLHARLKSVDLSASVAMKMQNVSELTPEEVETFESNFWSKF